MKHVPAPGQTRTNYRKQADEIMSSLSAQGVRKRLLLHVCCAPCSSACLELLTVYFDVTVLFYNPNITEEDEYRRRLEEEKRLIGAFNEKIARALPLGAPDERTDVPDGGRTPIAIIDGRYDPEVFLEASKGLEDAPEGGARCMKCFALRLDEAARVAALGDGQGPFDFFTTTLTISPLKNADALNGIGQEAARKAGSVFLPSDFKKKNGFLRSTLLSEQYDLYRQDYCGCVYSMLY